MSAEILRQAAALIRDRAAAATRGRWEAQAIGSEGYDIRGTNPESPIRRLRIARCGYESWGIDRANAEHIAAWNPEVALIVADVLEREADVMDGFGREDEARTLLLVELATACVGGAV